MTLKFIKILYFVIQGRHFDYRLREIGYFPNLGWECSGLQEGLASTVKGKSLLLSASRGSCLRGWTNALFSGYQIILWNQEPLLSSDIHCTYAAEKVPVCWHILAFHGNVSPVFVLIRFCKYFIWNSKGIAVVVNRNKCQESSVFSHWIFFNHLGMQLQSWATLKTSVIGKERRLQAKCFASGCTCKLHLVSCNLVLSLWSLS